MSLNRTVAPSIQDAADIPILVPEVITTLSGARVHIAHSTIQPIIRVEFVFKAGKWYQTRPALASLTAKMLLEGTTHRTAKQIAETADFYGATLDVSHGFDRSTVTLYCLSKFLPDLLPLFFEVIHEPAFLEQELALLKQRLIQTLSVDKQKNGYLASEAYSLQLYGPSHPYTTLITEEEINSVTQEDIKAFHATQYRIQEAEVFIAGEFSLEARNYFLKTLSSSATGEPIHNTLTFTATPSLPDLKHVQTKNQMQAAIRVGSEVVAPHHPDFPALYFTTHLLGGYFGSRLMKNIREEKGYTYGIYSSLSTKENSTTFTIGTEVKGDKTAETLFEIEKELKRLIVESVTDEELHTVKKHLSGKFVSDEATLFDQVDRYKSTVFLHLSPNHYHTLVKEFNDMTSEKIKETAERYIKFDQLLKVIAGGS
ncbi:insulinase family protein [Nibribacter ruber]|uniref:Insulinase family protein n=1 Tax=Nibribacter ruber TaxID=2698458 RepID=A0A6P1NZK5_9BACT|nr:pitrilysin family protein [Nibribacter ruber]QHL87709.1 insulinase family protein [Nibribacter ruber]